jgi:hypothetical protein
VLNGKPLFGAAFFFAFTVLKEIRLASAVWPCSITDVARKCPTNPKKRMLDGDALDPSCE